MRQAGRYMASYRAIRERHTLLEICESQTSRQFIFITPQDMHPFLKRRAPMPRVVKMNDVRPAGA